jgi:predicted HAD superfamily Cof-like phosphohydrolase
MSKDWFSDVVAMHEKYGFKKKLEGGWDEETAKRLLAFRAGFLDEEFTEFHDAVDLGDREGVIDSLIDLCVVAIGTLDLFDVDCHEAWNRVHEANMNKQLGVKPSRPNPLGLPDLVKPDGWKAPEHADLVTYKLDASLRRPNEWTDTDQGSSFD